MTPIETIRQSLPPHRQGGLSLVELMISLTIGVILLIGITSLIVQQSSSRDELEKSSRQIENGRYAMQILHDDIELAGYYGQYANIPAPTTGVVPDPCATSVASLDAAMPLPIQGYDFAPSSTAGSPISCLPSANYKPGTDILVIRRVDSASTSVAAASGMGGQVYLQANTGSHILNTGSNSSAFTLAYNTTTNTGLEELRSYLVHIYFISPCSVPTGPLSSNGLPTCLTTDDNGRPIPTLKRLELSASGASTTMNTLTPLVEGIENMQLDYGIDSDGDGYPNSYATACATATDASNCANVMAIRVNLLARNIECTTSYLDTKSYNLGMTGTISAPPATCTNGDFKRHVFSGLVQAINPSQRRAIQ
jgi:type IV pilus assembly protein PilW